MTTPSITIAIPVYNGAETISETIESVLSQLSINDELIVVDNNSTDGTSLIIYKYQLFNKNLKYFKNESNIGYDRNFNACFLNAKNDYVWLLGDDDILGPKSVAYVKNLLHFKNPDCLILNYGFIDRATNSIVKDSEIPITNVLSSTCNRSSFLSTLADYPIFISATIFSREAWLNSSPDTFFDTLFVHYGVYLSLVCNGTVIATNRTCVYNKCRLNNIEHKPAFYKSYLFNLKRLSLLIKNHYHLSKHAQLQHLLLRNLLDKNLLKYIYVHKRSMGHIPVKDFLFFVQHFRLSKSYFLGFVFMLVPAQLVYTYHRMFMQMRRFKRSFTQ